MNFKLISPKEVGSNLRFFRVTSNLTQKDVAEKLLLNKSTISCYENGKITPTIYTLILFARLYQCKVEDFITEGEKKHAGVYQYDYDKVDRIELAI